MVEPQKMIEWRSRAGAPFEADGLRITPEAQALTVSLPFFRFVWNRPVAVIVERQNKSERIPIVDVTRVALLAIAGFIAGLAIAVRFANRRKEK